MVHYLPTLRHSGLLLALVSVCWLWTPGYAAYAQFAESKVSTSDGDDNDRFGKSVSIDGSSIVIGAFRDDDAGLDAGAAYVYDLENDAWVHKQKLIPDRTGIGLSRIDRGLFGSSLDMRDDVIVVGAIDSRENGLRIGAAYTFERSEDGKWTQTMRLTPFDPELNAEYATTVATNAGYVMIGSMNDDHTSLTDAGSVYVYRRNQGGDPPWTYAQKITADDARAGDGFGWYVAMDGNRAVIGARNVDDRAEDAGAAYIYELSGQQWQRVAKLYASDAKAQDNFGEVVAIHGNRIIVGARGADEKGDESGAAYIFERLEGRWVETAKLLANDGASLDRLGSSVAIEDDYAIVSTRIDNNFTGAAYVFQRFSSSWSLLAKVVPDQAEAGDLFGQAIGLSNSRFVSSAEGDDDQGVDAGAAYIFDLGGTDRGVLVSLYNNTNGTNWSRKNNWLSENDIGAWDGVTTNIDGRVTALQLGANNLTGTLPAAIGSLPFLERLELNNNALTGPVPAEIRHLGSLQVIDLGNNQLGPGFPGSIVEVSGLREVYLDNNRFAGAVPAGLANLAQVQNVHLEGNLLEDLPDLGADGAFGSLQEFWVQSNRLTFEDLEPNTGLPGLQYAPQAKVGEPRSETLAQNNPLILQVQVEGASNIYQWKKNGVSIPGANTDTYIKPTVTSSDAGVYVLEVTNSQVAGLTLFSESISVTVLPVVEFATSLKSIHVIEPVLSGATGSARARLLGNTLTISGLFQGLESEFSEAAVHIGAPRANTGIAFKLTPTFNGQQGAFLDGENSFQLSNQQLIALQNSLLYLEIETLRGPLVDPSQPELRGQLYLDPNLPPTAPSIISPANDTTIDLGIPGHLEVQWNAVSDPQGHPVHYLWALSRNAGFQTDVKLIERITRVDTTTTITLSHSDVDAFLASKGVSEGASVTFYHYVAASDGSLVAPSDVFRLTLTRSSNNQGPFVANPVQDFVYLLDDGLLKMDLTSIFEDPDGDDLTFSALSSNENTALVNIDRDSLVITPLGVGQATISIMANDDNGARTQDEFVLTLNESPQVVGAIPDLNFNVGDSPFSEDLTLIFSDDDALTFSASSNNETVATVALDAGGTQVTITPGSPGAAKITITAEDDKNGMSSLDVQIIVRTDITPPQSVVENVSMTFGNPDLETSYRLVGLPGTVDLSIRNAIGGVPEEDWIAFRDTGEEGDREQYLERFDGSARFNFRPGRGFWLLSKNQWDRSDSRPTVSLNGDGTYSIPLQTGWNIISNPYDIDVPWQAIVQANSISQSLHRWTAGRFVQTPTFSTASTGEAFYFFNSENLDQLTLPYVPATPAAAAPVRIPALSLTVKGKGEAASTVRLGVHDEAQSGEDKLDQIAPPRAFEPISLRAIQPETPVGSRKKFLAEQYEPANQRGYRYEISLFAPPKEPLTLTFEKDQAAAPDQKFILFDKTLAKRYDLNRNPSFTFWPESPEQNLVLLVGDDAYIESEASNIRPAVVALMPNYPNPFADRTMIEFALVEPTSVRLVVYDALGRQVCLLENGVLDAGHHSVAWEGRDDAGSPLGSGLYFYRLQMPETSLVRSAILRR